MEMKKRKKTMTKTMATTTTTKKKKMMKTNDVDEARTKCLTISRSCGAKCDRAQGDAYGPRTEHEGPHASAEEASHYPVSTLKKKKK